MRGLYLDTDGSLWIGTIQGSVYRWADGRVRVQQFEGAAPRGEVWSMVRDRENAMWLGTLDGLFRIKDGQIDAFHHRERPCVEPDAIAHARADGTLWIGTTNGVASYARDLHDAHLWRAARSFDVSTMTFDREGSMWVGSRTDGLLRVRRGQFTSYAARDGLPADYVATVIEDSQGTIWIGTDAGSARSGMGASRNLSNQRAAADAAVFVDRGSTAPFVGGDRRRRLQIDAAARVPRHGVRPALRPGDRGFARVLFEDRDGTVWIGTNLEGLVSYRNGVLTKYTTKEGLPNDAVRAIQQDRDGSLWIGTRGGGLARFKDGAFRTYTEKDGLATSACSRCSWTGTTRCGSAHVKD